MVELPPFVVAEGEALVEEIHFLFGGVRREGGVSWHEADVIDDHGSAEERARARALDRDHCWANLLEPGRWEVRDSDSRWSFLDSIGFCYYLPAAMVRSITRHEEIDLGMDYRLKSNADRLAQLLSLEQLQCIKRYLQFMVVAEAFRYGSSTYLEALSGYWGNALPKEIDALQPPKKQKHRKR